MNQIILAFSWLCSLLTWAIVFRSFALMIFRDFSNPIVKILIQFTEPILGPCRNFLNRFNVARSGVDFSPFLAILLIGMVRRMVISLLVF